MTVTTRRALAERLGRRAEQIVAFAYFVRGYQILEKRFRAPGGELDLVARKGALIVFIEVKLRADRDAAVLAVTPKNRRRLERAAATYLALRPHFGAFAVRYDIAVVAGWRVALVKDAWRARA